MVASAKKKLSDRPLSPIDRADCEAFERELTRFNEDRPEAEWLIPASLARIAQPLGGSAYATQWSAYRHARVAMPLINMLIFALVIGKRPPDVFPSLQRFDEYARDNDLPSLWALA